MVPARVARPAPQRSGEVERCDQLAACLKGLLTILQPCGGLIAVNISA
jgi:hypothetical protein